MKAVILAGGYGTRISEESGVRPKPMVEIGGRPILWHIMKIYAHHGITDFVVCCGYKGHLIKQYFSDYFLLNSDVTFRMDRNEMQVHRNNAEPWTVTLVDTGQETMTGGRLRRVREYLDDSTFCLTYGDGVGDVDISAAKQLYLVVSDGGNGFACDWADWIDPVLVGPNGEVKLSEIKWQSATSGWGEARVGKNAGGAELKVGGNAVQGIGVHANSVIVYDIGGKGFTRFKELENRAFAEYVLIGTLLSSGLAILIAVAARQLA